MTPDCTCEGFRDDPECPLHGLKEEDKKDKE